MGWSPCLIQLLSPLPLNASSEEISARDVINHLQLGTMTAQDNLQQAKIQQVAQAHRTCVNDLDFRVGNCMLVSTQDQQWQYKRRGSKQVAKFMPCYDGPFCVMATYLELSNVTVF
ncbi:hypothetical protein J132_09140 [Termitomyces sp. J132]|nr:hypothetical protein J132_09140 [Termitomyces sp. J132]